MPQALPILPQLPGLDGRTAEPRLRPADPARRSEHRELFDRLLDRFSRPDAANHSRQDTPKEAAPEDLADRVADSAGEDVADARGEPAEKDTAPAKERSADAAAPTPDVIVVLPAPATVAQVQAESVAASAAPVVQPEAALSVQDQMQTGAGAAQVASGAAEAATTTLVSSSAAATTVAPVQQVSPGDQAVPAAVQVDKNTATPVDMAADDKKLALARATVGSATEIAPEQPLGRKFDLDALQARVEPEANLAQQRPDVKAKGAAANGMAQTIAPLTMREESAALNGRSEQPMAAFAADSPRSAAALYHKIAEAARPAAADAPPPAEQLSMRLPHAVADGKRAIQVHLHPAELGSIDVKMQWQGDRMTAQFLVERPETLQLLQRDMPALERSLNLAGVNVDSGSLQFSLRQQQDQGRSGGQGFTPSRGAAVERMDARGGDEPLGQILREGVLSIRV